MSSELPPRMSTGQHAPKVFHLVALDALDAAALAPGLSAALTTPELRTGSDLGAALEAGPDARVLVLIRSPEESLAMALAAAEDGSAQTFARWLEARRALLAQQRRNRRRLLLLDVAFLRGGGGLPRELADTLGAGEALTAPLPGAEAAAGLPPAPRFLAGASLLLSRHAEASALAQELAAATHGSSAGMADAELFAELDGWQQEAADFARLAEALQAAGGLDDDLRQRAGRDRALALRLSRERISHEAEARAEAESRRSGADLERDLLRENIALQLQAAEQMQASAAAELEALRRKAARDLQLEGAKSAALEARLAEALDRLQRHSAILGNEILRANQGISRLTADLGKARRRLEDLTAEGERTARELSLTRSERDRLAVDAQRSAEELAGLRADRDRLAAESDQHRDHAERLSAELDRVYGSRSWRVTGPLRAVRAHTGKPRE